MGLDNPIHIVFIVVILLLVFGAKRLPEIGRSLGSGMREFKDSVSGNQTNGGQQQQPMLTPTAQQPQQAPVAQPAPVQAPAPPVVAPPAPAQAAPATAPVEQQPQPQHQA